jgi:glucokinase
MMHTIDPNVIVFTGGMIGAGEPFLERIRWHVRQMAFPVPASRTQIRYSQLGTDAGFIGAAACGRQRFRKELAT